MIFISLPCWQLRHNEDDMETVDLVSIARVYRAKMHTSLKKALLRQENK